jgi:hypothetical protein
MTAPSALVIAVEIAIAAWDAMQREPGCLPLEVYPVTDKLKRWTKLTCWRDRLRAQAQAQDEPIPDIRPDDGRPLADRLAEAAKTATADRPVFLVAEPTAEPAPAPAPPPDGIASLRRMGLDALADEEQRRLAWISVEERLPEPALRGQVLGWGLDGYSIAYWESPEERNADGWAKAGITHWQPLPPLPEPDTPTPPQNRPSEPLQPAGPTSDPSDEPAAHPEPPVFYNADDFFAAHRARQLERSPEKPPPAGAVCRRVPRRASPGRCARPAVGWHLPDDEAEPAVPACEEHATEIAAPGSAAWMRERAASPDELPSVPPEPSTEQQLKRAIDALVNLARALPRCEDCQEPATRIGSDGDERDALCLCDSCRPEQQLWKVETPQKATIDGMAEPVVRWAPALRAISLGGSDA